MSLVRRTLLRRLSERGARVDEIERTLLRAKDEKRSLTVAERQHLQKLHWARESGLMDTLEEDRAELRQAQAERWMALDLAPIADDLWLLDPDAAGDDSWLALYDQPSPIAGFLHRQGLIGPDDGTPR